MVVSAVQTAWESCDLTDTVSLMAVACLVLAKLLVIRSRLYSLLLANHTRSRSGL